MTSSDVRDKLVEALVLDLIGPIDDPARANERLDQSPSRWYLTGFLVPRARPSMDLPKEEEDDEDEPVRLRTTTRSMSPRPTPCRSTTRTRPPSS